MLQRKQRNTSTNTSLKPENYNRKKIIFILMISLFIPFSFYIFWPSSKNVNENFNNKLELKIPEIKKDSVVKEEAKIVENFQRKTQIEILNGCGLAGLTGNFKKFFLNENLDVIGIANYKDFLQKKSFFIVYDEKSYEIILNIAKKMKIDSQLIQREFSKQPLTEVIFVIGSDYPKLAY